MKITTKDLATELAERLTDAMDIDALAQYFYDRHVEYYQKEATLDQLESDARDLRLLEEGEGLEIVDFEQPEQRPFHSFGWYDPAAV